MSDLPWESEGTGAPPLVLLHAAVSGREMWAPLSRLLSVRHRVVTYDARGFGQAPSPTADWYDHEDLVGVLDAAGIRRAVLVGASNGGRIALDAAAEAPDRVAGLVLLAPALPRAPAPSMQERYAAAEDAALERSDVDAARRINVDHWLVGMGRSVSDLDPTVLLDASGWMEAQLRRDAEPQLGEAQEITPPLIDRLSELDAPTIVLVGEHDQPRCVLVAGLLAGGLPHARVQWVPGAAHLPSVERPDVVARAVRGLLRELPAPADR